MVMNLGGVRHVKRKATLERRETNKKINNSISMYGSKILGLQSKYLVHLDI